MRYLLLLALSLNLYSAEVVLDRIVAVVNEDIITDSDLTKYSDTFRMHRAAMTEEEYNDISVSRPKLLNKMIDEKIISQHAQEKDMKATEEDVREAIERITRQFNMSLPQLKKQLESEGIDYDVFRAEKKKEIEFSKVLESEIRRTSNVSEDDLIKYFKQKTKEDVNITEYRIAAVITSKEEKAQKAIAQYRSGTEFSEIVQEYSEDEETRPNDGDLGFSNPSELIPELRDAVSGMGLNDIKGPVKTKHGFYVIKLNELRNTENPHFTAKKEDLRREVTGNELNRQLSLWLERKRSESYVKINV